MKNPLDNLDLAPAERALLEKALAFLLRFTAITLVAGLIAMSIMKKHQLMIVPKIIGMDQSQAERALSSKGLVMKADKQQYDDRVPAGLVSSQIPRANAYVRRGQVVEVVISKGNPKVRVPSVEGQSLAEAQISLAGLHLRAGRQSLIHSSEPVNTVLAQVPAPDDLVDSATEVDLLLSDGLSTMSYLMPDLLHKPLEQAFKTLRPAGITIQKITSEVHDDLDSGTVLTQDPAPGTHIQAKDSVSFSVSAKSADANSKPRYSKVVFDMPLGNPKRLQVDIFDGTGTRTIYNKMESPKDHVELGVSVTGKAFAEIYLNQEFLEEIAIP
jgi:beta-lactam-binding protein with PASTA domain